MTKNKLAAAWIELQSLPQDSHDAEQRMWAAEELNLLALRSPNKCWDSILEIISLSDDEWVLTNLGAGPIENMLALNPEIAIALIEKEFPENKKLQDTVENIWKNIIPNNVWERLLALKNK